MGVQKVPTETVGLKIRLFHVHLEWVNPLVRGFIEPPIAERHRDGLLRHLDAAYRNLARR